MNARHLVRRLAKGAGIAFIAGSLGGAALLAAEAMAARSRRYAKPDLGLAVRATLGTSDKPTLRLVLLGDSSALGVGVDTVDETVGGQLARMLADAGAKVALSTVAVAGARCADLATQVGPVFRADPGMLCHDGFHPSADGYRVMAYALYPELANAANLSSSIKD